MVKSRMEEEALLNLESTASARVRKLQVEMQQEEQDAEWRMTSAARQRAGGIPCLSLPFAAFTLNLAFGLSLSRRDRVG